jgi:hypothetical protein
MACTPVSSVAAKPKRFGAYSGQNFVWRFVGKIQQYYIRVTCWRDAQSGRCVKNSSYVSEQCIRMSPIRQTCSSGKVRRAPTERVIQWLNLLLRNREVPDSKFGSEIDYIDRDPSRSSKSVYMPMLGNYMPQIRPRPLPFTSFSIHYSLKS